MSIQEHARRYDTPEQTLSSSMEVRRGNEKYDPFAADDDDGLDNQPVSPSHPKEQSRSIHQQKPDTSRMNNGTMPSIVMNEQSSEDQLRDRSRSPTHNRTKHSDRRPRSPYNRNHHSSDRKRLRPSSPSEQISSDKSKKSYRSESENKSKSPSPLSHRQKYPSKSSDSNDDKPPSNGSENNGRQDNHVSRHSSKRDDHQSYRSHSSRHYHQPSSSFSSRHSSSSSHQSYFERRTSNPSENVSSPSRLLSTTSASQTAESKGRETSTEDQSRIFNRLRSANDANTNTVTSNHNTNKSSASSQPANGAPQRARSNLIQIVTTSQSSASKQMPPVRLSSAIIKPEPVQNKVDAIKPSAGVALPAKLDTKPPSVDSSVPSRKTNGGTADDMLMEEMLLEEEQEQTPVKPIDLDSLTIPSTTTQKLDSMNAEPAKITTTPTTTTTPTNAVSAPSLTPSPTKKIYKLYKVPRTNHTTPPLSSRHRKPSEKESSGTQPNSIVTDPASTDETVRPTSLDERISTILGAPSIATNSQNEPVIETRGNPPQPLSTPSDRSTESPQDIPSLISTMSKKGHEHAPVPKKSYSNDERRSSSSKHYTSEWLASQKPEEATAMPTEELPTLPSLVNLPTLGSTANTQSSISITTSSAETNNTVTVDKLTEVMSKLIQKQKDSTGVPTTEGEETVPISAKHLERQERRKQREKRQSEIAAIAKEALKPAFRKHDITKEEYKEIMKKVVTKATQANEIDRVRIGKMVNAYVEKYRLLRQKLSQASSTSNGTRH